MSGLLVKHMYVIPMKKQMCFISMQKNGERRVNMFVLAITVIAIAI